MAKVTSMKLNLKPISVIETRIGIQKGGPAHAHFTELCMKAMDKYVPMSNQSKPHLADSVTNTVDEIIYPGPYAHYIYEGRVMGPNIPIKDKNGRITGWWSKAPKYYTGEEISYNTNAHPLATHHWDKAMWSAEKKDIEKELQDFVNRGCK